MSDAWVGLVGAVVGTIVGGGLTFLIARWQANRDDGRERGRSRRVVYGQFHATAGTAYWAIRRYVGSDDPQDAGDVAKAIAAMTLASGDLSAVATVQMIERADVVADRVTDLAGLALAPGLLVNVGDPWVEGGPLDAASAAYHEAVHEFLWATRDD